MDKQLISILKEGHHSLVVSNKEIHTYNGKGVTDLYTLINSDPSLLYGSQIADKIVGKAAASLIIKAKASELYAETISHPALEMLKQYNIPTNYGTIVPNILNRDSTGLCPLETRCLQCSTPNECYNQITTFITEIKTKHQPQCKQH